MVPTPDPTHIRSPLAAAAPISRVRRGGAQECETILYLGGLGPVEIRFAPLDPSGLTLGMAIVLQSPRSGGFHDGALDDDAAGRIFPEGDQQLAREGDNGRLAHPSAVALDTVLKPAAQC